jgi:medium-chain acyl-[acyl-carrier-protein] hydrolase
MAEIAKSPWFPFGIRHQAQVCLLCLPHAGAGASAYRAWAAGMTKQIDAVPVQPPGRETRRRELPFSNVQPLVTALARDLVQSLHTPYAVFGHSTGAISAFELTREMRRMGGPTPLHLFVAGRRAPQIPMGRSNLASLTAGELAELLRRLGGTPEVFLDDHEMLKIIQPLLAADFSVNENYLYISEAPLNVPITAFSADADPYADRKQVSPWSEQTSRSFNMHSLAGGHFAIFEQAPRIHAWIAEALLIPQR